MILKALTNKNNFLQKNHIYVIPIHDQTQSPKIVNPNTLNLHDAY